MNPIIYHDLPEQEYHSQTGEETPLFSYSTAKVLNEKSAYHAYLQHPLLGNEKSLPTEPMIKGSILHGLLLGGGPKVSVLNFDNYKTKLAQETKKAVIAEGKIPILEIKMAVIYEAKNKIIEQIKELAPYFFEPHESELSVRWTMDNGVKCQSRFDWIKPETGLIIDLKTISADNHTKLDTHILNFGYDIQEAMYMQCANKTWPDMAGRFKWEFIFVEPEPPYMVSVVETDTSMSWLGESKVKRAADKWKECLESGVFPGYGRQMVSAPGWAVSREEGK